MVVEKLMTCSYQGSADKCIEFVKASHLDEESWPIVEYKRYIVRPSFETFNVAYSV